MHEDRRQRIALAIVNELERQSEADRLHAPMISDRAGLKKYNVDGAIDIEALSAAIEAVLDGHVPGEPADEGIPVDQLSSSNDG